MHNLLKSLFVIICVKALNVRYLISTLYDHTVPDQDFPTKLDT